MYTNSKVYELNHCNKITLPLQDRQQPFSYLGGGGIFIVLVKKISEPSSVKIYFSHEKESKTFFSYHVEQKYIFP